METFSYNPDRTYSLKEFEEINDSLKVREVQINGTPVSHFERDSKGHLIPMPQTPILREVVAGEILRQLANWNIQTRQNGAPTSSQGGFNFGEGIRAPDVAFTPREVYRALDKDQLLTFHGDPFSPTFVVEVENVSETCKLDELTDRFKTTYFPAGVELGWLVDPVNKDIYVFRRDRDNAVRRCKHGWYDDDGNPTVVDGWLRRSPWIQATVVGD
jgi:Uma2 family endonuclease